MLYFASSSKGRKRLLDEAGIVYTSINHTSDEIIDQSSIKLNLEEYTERVSRMKIQHVSLSDIDQQEKTAWILVADTMVENADGEILGKPNSYEEARSMLKSLGKGWCKTASSFIVQKIKLNEGRWTIESEHSETITTLVLCDLDDERIESYINHEKERVFTLASSLTIQDFGAQFIKEINGSYTNIIGLPMHEVTKALRALECPIY